MRSLQCGSTRVNHTLPQQTTLFLTQPVDATNPAGVVGAIPDRGWPENVPSKDAKEVLAILPYTMALPYKSRAAPVRLS